MVCIDKKAVKLDKFLAILLGISVSEGISAIFTIGNTTFTFAEVISPLIFIYFWFRDGRILTSFVRCVPVGFKLFFGVLAFSIVPGVVYFMSFSVVSRYVVGLIYFLIILTTAIDVFFLQDSRENIIYGVFIGLVLNIVYSLFCYINFQRGVIISLNSLIGRQSFYAPLYSFRSQGYFLEPSHFSRYVISIIIIIIATIKIKKWLFKWCLVLFTIVALGLSYSGSLVILIIGLGVYYLGNKRNTCSSISYQTLVIFFILLLADMLIAMGVIPVDVSSIPVTINRILRGAIITDEGNYVRYNSIRAVLQQWDAAILGCGWNLAGVLIQSKSISTVAAFSALLEMVVETGMLGGALYVVSTVMIALRLWRMREPYSRALSVSLMMILALQIGTDYAFNSCIMLVFGLAISQLQVSSTLCGEYCNAK